LELAPLGPDLEIGSDEPGSMPQARVSQVEQDRVS
jgi:hypothetical protein